MKNVEFPVVVLIDLEGQIRHFRIEKFGVNTNIQDQVLDVLPTIMQEFATTRRKISSEAKFRAYWYGSNRWIENTSERIHSNRNGQLLIAVESTTNMGKSPDGFTEHLQWLGTVDPGIKALLPEPESLSWYEAIEAKPGVFGFRVDLKMLLSRLGKWWKRARGRAG